MASCHGSLNPSTSDCTISLRESNEFSCYAFSFMMLTKNTTTLLTDVVMLNS